MKTNFLYLYNCFIAATLFLSTVLHPALAVENRVSQTCQVSIADCLQRMSKFNKQPTTDVCKLMTTKYRSVTAYHCLVRVGLCTEGEYDILMTIACQGSPDVQSAAALAKLNLYRTINLAPVSCQNRTLFCIRKYITTIILKQQEHFCALVNLDINGVTSQSCMTGGGACSEEHYRHIYDAACDTALIEKDFTPFVKAVQFISPICRHSIEICYSLSQNVRLLINSEMYCDVMKIHENGTSTHGCLVDNGACTDEEFNQLEQSACKGSTLCLGVVACIAYILVGVFQINDTI